MKERLLKGRKRKGINTVFLLRGSFVNEQANSQYDNYCQIMEMIVGLTGILKIYRKI